MPWWGWLLVWVLAGVIFCVGWYVFNKPLRNQEDEWRQQVLDLLDREKSNGLEHRPRSAGRDRRGR